jgi:hypothetical protein
MWKNRVRILMSDYTPRLAITVRLTHIPGTVDRTDINLNVILRRCLRLPSGLFFQVSQPKSTRVLRHAQLMPLYPHYATVCSLLLLFKQEGKAAILKKKRQRAKNKQK